MHTLDQLEHGNGIGRIDGYRSAAPNRVSELAVERAVVAALGRDRSERGLRPGDTPTAGLSDPEVRAARRDTRSEGRFLAIETPDRVAAGRAEDTVDNSTGANGAAGVTVRRGVFRFKNYASDAITQADLLADCYIYDDETVARTNGAGARSKAGKILDLDATGVFVEIA